MTGPQAALLPGGPRLHLQHGPIDLIIGAEGAAPEARLAAFRAARRAFDGLLERLVAELSALRRPLDPEHPPQGPVAMRMARAVAPHGTVFVTPMAAVAGAVADEILARMRTAAPLDRVYVNNGGDIALHLAPGARFRLAIAGSGGADLGRVTVVGGDGVGGIATSGRGGRSLSLGIADAVTVLAGCAAEADAAATLIANAVDLPGHKAILRAPAEEIDPQSDLGTRPVVTGCGRLSPEDAAAALARGRDAAAAMAGRGLIRTAALVLQGQSMALGEMAVAPPEPGALAAHA
ncbi:hypothetical protein DDZ14_15195 [Maritimibacter sp. 55A14]|uniref:UPF0280 family protein n=1 Tax=Maritimibacter sp. 55A14 TaxID=2174844 RepID=UPI000D60C859|nr:UPF0280 family protein [Maritimibacter sp. 55A14]PWE30504.1 hypothetical protein DDZ14_15195 [Maritimibacter sp. 55A14]